MSLPSNLKPLYEEWLQEEIVRVGPKQERLAMVYSKALDNLRSHEGTLFHPNDLLKVKGIGNAIKNSLKGKLSKYCMENGLKEPHDPLYLCTNESSKRGKTRLRSLEKDIDEEGNPNKKQRKKRAYIPKKRSGAYAILLALLETDAKKRGMTKDEVVSVAHKFSDTNFVSNASTKEFYSAWNSVKTLIDRSLVLEDGRPKRYFLSDEGEQLAETLKKMDNILFANEDEYQRRKQKQQGGVADVNNSVDDLDEFSANLSELMKHTYEPRQISRRDMNTATGDTPKNLSSMLQRTHTIAISSPSDATIISNNPTASATVIPAPRSHAPLRGTKDQVIRARWNNTSYELWEPCTYDVILILDHREVRSRREREFFANALTQKGVKAEVRQLSLSDMLWVARHKITKKECVLNFMLERKRLDDFAMSIMDNRFMEQKNRLKKTGCKNIYYLIEETTGTDVSKMAEAMKTSVWMTMIYNDFHVKRTKNSDETVEWLSSMTGVIQNHYQNFKLLVLCPRNLKGQDDYKATLDDFRNQFERQMPLPTKIECCHRFDCFQEVLGKNTLMTVKELYLRALMLNRGVSLEKAVSIQSKYPTLKSLITAYKKCPSEAEAKMMICSSLKDAPGNRKIGKALSETLYKTFGYST